MELAHDAARVATAGYVLVRLLDEPPGPALVEMFTDPVRRETWPVRDDATVAALDDVRDEGGAVLAREHGRLFDGPRAAVPLRESAWLDGAEPDALRDSLLLVRSEQGLTQPLRLDDDRIVHHLALLAGLATRMKATADQPLPDGTLEASAHVRGRLDAVIDPVLRRLEAEARTTLHAVLPVLVRGFLAAHGDLVRSVQQEWTNVTAAQNGVDAARGWTP